MTSMDDLALSLARRLEEELGLYSELEAALREQLLAMISDGTGRLQEVTAKVETFNDLLMASEKRRRLVLEAIAGKLGLELAQVTLRRVAEVSTADEGRRLTQLGMRLRLKLRDVTRLRDQVRSLMEKESRFYRTRLAWLVDKLQDGSYTAEGQRSRHNTAPRMLDRKA
jgi:hypothetical protein